MIKKIVTLTFLFAIASACGSGTTKENIIKSMQPSLKSPQKVGEQIFFRFTSSSKVDSAQLYIDNRYIATTNNNTILYQSKSDDKVGEHSYKFVAYRKRANHEKSGKFMLLPAVEPKSETVKSKATLPHSRDSYTQGLEFYDGKLYESSGEYGKSYLKIMEFPSMKVLKRVDLESQYFAEGLTILNDKLYLLTWKEKRVFVYDAKTLEKLDEFSYNTEGWGLTNDGKHLYMSDGTKYIYKIDPNGFKIVDKIEVLSSKGEIDYVNELEWIDGKIWANIYGYESIIVVDPSSGTVENIKFFNGILDSSMKDETTDVMNGIALDKVSGKVYVTGKNWPLMFEIER